MWDSYASGRYNCGYCICHFCCSNDLSYDKNVKETKRR